MRSFKHSLVFFTLSALSLFYGFKFFAIIFAAVGLVKFYNWYQHPHRKLWEKIKRDASKFQVQIPAKISVKQNLLKLYSRVELLTVYHPYTKETLTEMIYSLWKSLKYNPNLMTWASEIDQTVLALPNFNQVEINSDRTRYQAQVLRDHELWQRAAQKAQRP